MVRDEHESRVVTKKMTLGAPIPKSMAIPLAVFHDYCNWCCFLTSAGQLVMHTAVLCNAAILYTDLQCDSLSGTHPAQTALSR